MATWKCKYCGRTKEVYGEKNPNNMSTAEDLLDGSDCIVHESETPGCTSWLHVYERQWTREEIKAREEREATQRETAELRTAAEQGDANAQYKLGLLYLSDDGSKHWAVEWFERAAGQGHEEAKISLLKIEEKAKKDREAKEAAEEEKAKKDREAKEAAEREAKYEAHRLAWEAAEKAKKEKIANIGLVLQLGVTAAYLFILWGTDIVNSLWLKDEILRLLPLAAFSVAVGVISVIFLRKSNYGSGLYILVGMIVIQAITASVWTGNVGFLFVNLIGRGVLNIISIIPGAILVAQEFK